MLSRFGGVLDDLEWPLSGREPIDDGDLAALLQQWTAALIEACQQRLQATAEGPPTPADQPTP
jgi:hypothetical protein